MTWPKTLRVDAPDSPGGWWGTIWPIGALYFSTANVDPSSVLGFGTWRLFANGKLLMAPTGPNTDIYIWERTS